MRLRPAAGAALALLLAAAAPAALPPGYETLYLSRHATPQVEQSAAVLAGLLERTFGERPAIRREPLVRLRRGIHIGPAPDHAAFDDDPLTDEVLVERTARGLAIHGSDNTATCFAIYRFLEDGLGWRYFQPGPLGLERLDDPPATPAVDGPPETLLLERAGFVSRTLTSMRGAGGGPDWEQWHGLRERFSFNHAVHRIVPPSLFETHPGWFAKDEAGRPVRPPYPQPHGYNDHPDLANPELRAYVTGRTIAALEAAAGGERPEPTMPLVRLSPGVISTSLSLGDSFVFGSFPAGYPLAPDGYFRRYPDWANHVMDYTNAVAAAASRAWAAQPWPGPRKPELYMGALSYLNWENVPDFQVHPAVVPYLTYDRSQWYDPDARADDLALVEKWATRGPRVIGTWDYLFGYGFLIPRSLAGIVADSIPALHRRGVTAYFCQVGALWPYDAHTNWLITRLLWQPGAHAPALLDEFFREFYGPAAPAMRAFFEAAEAVWMRQQEPGWWLRHWKDPWQARLFPIDLLDQLQQHLDEAARLAGGEMSINGDFLPRTRFAERVAQTADLFGLTRLLAGYQELAWRLQATAWERADAAALRSGARLAEAALTARAALADGTARVVRAHPNAAQAADLQWVFLYDSLAASLTALARRAEAVAHDDRALADSLRAALAAAVRASGQAGLPGTGPGRRVLPDPRLRLVDDPVAWKRQFMDTEGMAVGKLTASGGFFAENVRRGHLYQLFQAQPGNFYYGSVDLAEARGPVAGLFIRLDFFDKDLAPLAESRLFRMAPADLHGGRQRLRALMRAPEGAAYGRLFIRFFEMSPGSRAELFSAEVLDLGRSPTP